jgi:hypothetical protein
MEEHLSNKPEPNAKAAGANQEQAMENRLAPGAFTK